MYTVSFIEHVGRAVFLTGNHIELTLAAVRLGRAQSDGATNGVYNALAHASARTAGVCRIVNGRTRFETWSIFLDLPRLSSSGLATIVWLSNVTVPGLLAQATRSLKLARTPPCPWSEQGLANWLICRFRGSRACRTSSSFSLDVGVSGQAGWTLAYPTHSLYHLAVAGVGHFSTIWTWTANFAL